MKTKSVAIVLLLILGVIISGCMEHENTENIFTKTDNTEEKIVGSAGGNLFFLEYHVYVDFPENAVDDDTNIIQNFCTFEK